MKERNQELHGSQVAMGINEDLMFFPEIIIYNRFICKKLMNLSTKTDIRSVFKE